MFIILWEGEVFATFVSRNISPRELFIHGKAMVPYVKLSTNYGLDNSITVQFFFSLYLKPILQLVDNCTYGTIAFPCIKSSLISAIVHTFHSFLRLNVTSLCSFMSLLSNSGIVQPCFKKN